MKNSFVGTIWIKPIFYLLFSDFERFTLGIHEAIRFCLSGVSERYLAVHWVTTVTKWFSGYNASPLIRRLGIRFLKSSRQNNLVKDHRQRSNRSSAFVETTQGPVLPEIFLPLSKRFLSFWSSQKTTFYFGKKFSQLTFFLLLKLLFLIS